MSRKPSQNNHQADTYAMTQTIHFTKMHGAGNDYIYVDASIYNIADPSAASRAWSDRHRGIGSDGLVLIGRASTPEADFTMHIYNADGSEAMMCGNASRCVGKYVYDRGLTHQRRVRLLTRSGVKVLDLHVGADGRVDSVTVDMGAPALTCAAQFVAPAAGQGPEGDPSSAPAPAEGASVGQEGARAEVCDPLADLPPAMGRPTLAGAATGGADAAPLPEGTFVSMGNPHYVIFVDDAEAVDVAAEGARLERHPAFPQRCNIEFATVRADGIRVRVWERGSGITQACGTGACATAVAACVTGRSGPTSHIVMDGGVLSVEWRAADRHVYKTGPAAFVFDGDIDWP